MTLKGRALAMLRRVLGKGWIYYFPRLYEDVIRRRFGERRETAFRHFVEGASGLRDKRLCLDLACGTGLTTLWMASACPHLRVVGIDASARMLRLARRRAKAAGVAGRCDFVRAQAGLFTRDDLRRVRPERDGGADVLVCALGFSVMNDWAQVFTHSLGLLADDGYYVIFDQYLPETEVPDFAADQSRRTWELVEAAFVEAETTWFDEMFIAIGRGKKHNRGAPSRVEEEVRAIVSTGVTGRSIS